LRSVKEVLLAPAVVERAKSRVRDLLNKEPLRIQRRIQSISEMLMENERKIENLLRLAEEGSNLKTVAARLGELEEIQQKLKEEKARLQRNHPPKGRETDIVREVTSFLENFESKILTAKIQERKELIRTAVEKIVVDRDQRKVRCYVRTLPKLPFLKEFSQPSSSILGATVALTGIEPVFQP
jgi:hypothetical protein